MKKLFLVLRIIAFVGGLLLGLGVLDISLTRNQTFVVFKLSVVVLVLLFVAFPWVTSKMWKNGDLTKFGKTLMVIPLMEMFAGWAIGWGINGTVIAEGAAVKAVATVVGLSPIFLWGLAILGSFHMTVKFAKVASDSRVSLRERVCHDLMATAGWLFLATITSVPLAHALSLH